MTETDASGLLSEISGLRTEMSRLRTEMSQGFEELKTKFASSLSAINKSIDDLNMKVCVGKMIEQRNTNYGLEQEISYAIMRQLETLGTEQELRLTLLTDQTFPSKLYHLVTQDLITDLDGSYKVELTAINANTSLSQKRYICIRETETSIGHEEFDKQYDKLICLIDYFFNAYLYSKTDNDAIKIRKYEFVQKGLSLR